MKKIALLCGLVMAILTLKPQSAKAQFCIPTFTTGCVNGDSIYYFQLGPYWDSTGCKSTTYKKKVYPGYDSIGAVIQVKILPSGWTITIMEHLIRLKR